MSQHLTERQNQAYEFIREFIRRQGKPPTLQEIGQALGIRSSNGVFKLLKALESKGYIRRNPHEARGILLQEEEEELFAFSEQIPSLIIVSRTHSASPEKLRRQPRGTLHIDPRLLRGYDPDECIIGLQGDDGMNGDGIYKGDLLIIHEEPWHTLKNHQLAAFLVGDRLIARRFVFINQKIHLLPADRTYTEEVFPPDHPDCYVIGRVISLIRLLKS